MPAHARSEDLIGLFSGLAPVAEAKVIGGQGFGFVTFMDPEMAADVLAVRDIVEIKGFRDPFSSGSLSSLLGTSVMAADLLHRVR